MFSFRGGFGWGIGGVLGKAFGVLLIVCAVAALLYFVFPRVASAIPWILGVVLYGAWVIALMWFGWKAEGRLRRRRLVLAGVLAIYGVLWIETTTITRIPSEQSSTGN